MIRHQERPTEPGIQLFASVDLLVFTEAPCEFTIPEPSWAPFVRDARTVWIPGGLEKWVLRPDAQSVTQMASRDFVAMELAVGSFLTS